MTGYAMMQKEHDLFHKPSILVMRNGAIGDVLLITPIIRQIYDDYDGNCHIDVLTLCPDVFENNPWVREVSNDLSDLAGGYEKIINLNLAYEHYPALHIADAYEFSAFGRKGSVKNKQPALFPLASDSRLVDEFLEGIKRRNFLVVHMRYGKWPSRNIEIGFWKEVIDGVLRDTDLMIIQVGAESDLALEEGYDPRVLDWRNRFSLQQLQLLIKKSAVFLGIDSGTLHVAASTDVPIVCLFTSAHHSLRKPSRPLDDNIFMPVAPAVSCYGCQIRFPPPITGVVCDQGDPFDPPCRHAFNAEDVIKCISLATDRKVPSDSGQFLLNGITCPICESSGDSVTPYDCIDFNRHCADNFGVVLPLSMKSVYYFRCETCDFVFCPEIHSWTPEQFKELIYNDEYIIADPEFSETRPGRHANFINDFFGSVKDNINLLDYGGGEGRMSDILSQKGFSITSHDPFFSRNQPPALHSADLITAFEVFEHTPSPIKMMEDIVSLLKPDGIVLFSTFETDGQLSFPGRLNWWYAGPRNGHISLYSMRSLSVLASRFGLKHARLAQGIHLFFNSMPNWAAPLFLNK